MTDPIPVRVRDCACPGTPHAEVGDLVYLAPYLDIAGGVRAERDLVEAQGDDVVLTQRWLDTFIRYGAKGWNLADAEGEAVPFDVEVILSNWSLARPLGDVASDLYAESIAAPFVRAQQVRSPTGPTGPTTSRTRRRTRT